MGTSLVDKTAVPIRRAALWGQPTLVAVGDPQHSAGLGRLAAQVADRVNGMVIIFTIADEGPASHDDPWLQAVDLASRAVDRYRVPYRIDVDRHSLSPGGVERARELAWYISDRARRWGAQLIVVGAPDGADARIEIHRHIAGASRTPVLPVPLPALDPARTPRPTGIGSRGPGGVVVPSRTRPRTPSGRRYIEPKNPFRH